MNGAFTLEWSPLSKPRITDADHLNTNTPLTLGASYEGEFFFVGGLRFYSATIPSAQVYDTTDFTTTYVTDAKMKIFMPYLGLNLPLNEPYGKLGGFQAYVPIQAGLPFLFADAGGTSFSSIGLDGAMGLGVRYYTRSILRPEITFLYHYGLPLLKVSRGFGDVNLQNSQGQHMKLTLTGVELRVGLSFAFPGDGEGAK